MKPTIKIVICEFDSHKQTSPHKKRFHKVTFYGNLYILSIYNFFLQSSDDQRNCCTLKSSTSSIPK